jgi:hypothetical protein
MRRKSNSCRAAQCLSADIWQPLLSAMLEEVVAGVAIVTGPSMWAIPQLAEGSQETLACCAAQAALFVAGKQPDLKCRKRMATLGLESSVRNSVV